MQQHLVRVINTILPVKNPHEAEAIPLDQEREEDGSTVALVAVWSREQLAGRLVWDTA